MSLQAIDPLTYTVLGPNATFRPDAFATPFFNPTNATPPFIQVFNDAFYGILGDSPLLTLVAESNLTTEAGVPKALAHEAPVWVAATDEVFFASAADPVFKLFLSLSRLGFMDVLVVMVVWTGVTMVVVMLVVC